MSANIAKGGLYKEVYFEKNQRTCNPRVIYMGEQTKNLREK